jgi:hypothetical protein
MTYASGGLIQASDYNTRASSVNQLWGAGSGNFGYGQSTTISQTQTSGTVVPASDWATMIARMSTMQQHQFNNTTGIPTQPTSGSIITYLSAIDTAITSLQSNRFASAASIPSAPLAVTSNGTTWHTSSVKTWTIAFASHDNARYFFNAGGAIQLVSINNAITPATWNSFVNTGYSYSYISVVSFAHFGTVGTYTRSVYNSGQGFYNLTSTPTSFLTMTETGTGNANYNANSIDLKLSYNGAGVITATLTLTDADTNVFGYTNTGSTQAYIQTYTPETTYLTNTWGTPTVTNTVNTQA